jgi:hypothetical protein
MLKDYLIGQFAVSAHLLLASCDTGSAGWPPPPLLPPTPRALT